MKRVLLLLLSVGIVAFCTAQENGARYLIITHDDYYKAIKPLAAWKTQKGLKTRIARLSEIGSDSTQIRDFIVNAYNTWQIKPEYLLLVGNKYQLPFPYFCDTPFGMAFSDNYYTNVTGDFHNEILPGRLWVFDTIEAKTIVTKILSYDKTPFMDNPQWFRKGTTIVGEDGTPHGDSVYWADSRYAHQLMNGASYLHIDSFASSYNDSSLDVINAINEGRSYILFRGGAYGTWAAPFSEIFPDDFDNGLKLPIVISATCATVEIIGYLWLNAGTPDQPKGMVGFFGTTTALDSASEMRSALAKGTLREIFSDSFATLGKAAESGRINYYQCFGNTLEYNSWTCLGDPEMGLRTTTPRTIDVTHSPKIWVGDTLTVEVTCNGQPLESVFVCVTAQYDTTFYHYDRTNSNGSVKFVAHLAHPDTGLITVTGRNLYPVVDTVRGGFTGGPYISCESYLILDTTGNGNGNFQPNNGENIELAVRVINSGDSTAYGVSGVIQKNEIDNYYSLSDTVKYFGDIACLDSAFTSADGFNISIAPYCPDSHLIKLKFELRDTTGTTWISFFNFPVYSARPYLIYESNAVIDSTGGNNDQQINPNENIDLLVWIKNIGDSLAADVWGTLQKAQSDQYFTLDDTIKCYGDILPMDTAWTGMDGYNIYIDSQCPDLHELKLRIRLKDVLDSIWVYNFSLVNHAPLLIYHNYYLTDSLKYILHGDTTGLSVFIKNAGTSVADSVSGHLFGNDSLILILDSDAQFGSIKPDSVGSNASDQFILSVQPSAPPGYLANLKLFLSTKVQRDTIDFNVYVGQRDYFVWDPDPNHSSGFIINQKLSGLNFLGDYSQQFPYDYLNVYKTLFISLGVTPYKYIIYDTSSVVPEIIHHINLGGRIYLEGGDVWFYDTTLGGYNFCPHFNITPINNSCGPFTRTIGYDNTFTRDMNFKHTGEHNSIDRIDPAGNGVAIFKNSTISYNCGVAANHQTIGISFEFSGLVDSMPPSTKIVLMDSIMKYFGIIPTGSINENHGVGGIKIVKTELDIYPNPANDCINIACCFGYKVQNLELKIYDITGRLVKTLVSGQQCAGDYTATWDGRDDSGREISSGIYFCELRTEDFYKTLKMVVLR